MYIMEANDVMTSVDMDISPAPVQQAGTSQTERELDINSLCKASPARTFPTTARAILPSL